MSVRILMDDIVLCGPQLPKPPQRQLELPNQRDLLLTVFGFASRDDLDAAQLTCTFWRDVVSNASGKLALRPLERVSISDNSFVIRRAPISEAMPADLFKIDWISNDDPMLDHSFDIPWGQRFPNDVFRPEDHLTVMSLLLAQHLAGIFRVKSVVLEYFDEHEEITSSLQLAGDMGVKDFVLLAFTAEDTVPLILANEVLLGAERFHLRIAHAIRMEFLDRRSTRMPTTCTQPTLRDVDVSDKVLPRACSGETFAYDVYHFRNQTTNEWLTVWLSKYNEDEGRIDFVLLQKGRTMESVEDIDKMEPFLAHWW
ncbi:hypothetical protein AAVH_09677 [Aphelenchoides avenae]|nr:hypothetical protein AAVH_09677 [Aphelenchus avenae]